MDANGSLNRSEVSELATDESSNGYTKPGGFRSNQLRASASCSRRGRSLLARHAAGAHGDDRPHADRALQRRGHPDRRSHDGAGRAPSPRDAHPPVHLHPRDAHRRHHRRPQLVPPLQRLHHADKTPTTLTAATVAGATTVNVANATNFVPGRKLNVDTGANLYQATIVSVATPGTGPSRSRSARSVTARERRVGHDHRPGPRPAHRRRLPAVRQQRASIRRCRSSTARCSARTAFGSWPAARST